MGNFLIVGEGAEGAAAAGDAPGGSGAAAGPSTSAAAARAVPPFFERGYPRYVQARAACMLLPAQLSAHTVSGCTTAPPVLPLPSAQVEAEAPSAEGLPAWEAWVRAQLSWVALPLAGGCKGHHTAEPCLQPFRPPAEGEGGEGDARKVLFFVGLRNKEVRSVVAVRSLACLGRPELSPAGCCRPGPAIPQSAACSCEALAASSQQPANSPAPSFPRPPPRSTTRRDGSGGTMPAVFCTPKGFVESAAQTTAGMLKGMAQAWRSNRSFRRRPTRARQRR